MTSEEFQPLFDREVVCPLVEIGFQQRGQSLFWRDEISTFGLIRLGGRNQKPGHICHVACFRHNFLRDLNEKIPSSPPTEVFTYPYKFLPSGSSVVQPYTPQNLNYDKEYLDYTGHQDDIIRSLQDLQSRVSDVLLPYARSLSPETAYEQILNNQEYAWIEKIWLADYESTLQNNKA
ncbi:hypothetical protein [Roseibacillus ishigakijimensis]|uniref:Uncharacterized protein n=1 Tax=Roseibacillus ishigakijimensis TaxID=454146 RepID=A0A934VP36_9BACT|nr:hypothetical protein [Roseibacillus ishigakijimensis]MBK1835696.1 hypothetical protein [Roseibacillus ishigakijimensis]